MALPSLKTINWVTTDCYGTLIDWERGILDACKKEAAKDGFSFEEQPFLDRLRRGQTGQPHFALVTGSDRHNAP